MATQAQLQRLVVRNSNSLLRVGILASNEVSKVLGVANTLTFNDQADLVRTTIPAIADRYGNISQVLALEYYEDYRNLNDVKGRFTPKQVSLDYTEKLDNLMGTGIALAYDKGTAAMQTYLRDGITRITSSYNRDTIITNATYDTQAARIQRVADANACAFCVGLALNAELGGAIVSGDMVIEYENDWHDNCGCTAEVIYEGQDLIRPSYYDSMEADYNAAQESLVAKQDAAVAQAKADGTFTKYRTFLKENPELSVNRGNIARELRQVSNRK